MKLTKAQERATWSRRVKPYVFVAPHPDQDGRVWAGCAHFAFAMLGRAALYGLLTEEMRGVWTPTPNGLTDHRLDAPAMGHMFDTTKSYDHATARTLDGKTVLVESEGSDKSPLYRFYEGDSLPDGAYFHHHSMIVIEQHFAAVNITLEWRAVDARTVMLGYPMGPPCAPHAAIMPTKLYG